MQLKGKRIWVAGHTGMLGSALVRKLSEFDCDVVTVDKRLVDLRNYDAITRWLDKQTKIDVVFLAAAKVGGIHANIASPATFMSTNLSIGLNALNACYFAGVKKVMVVGAPCIYPRLCPQPMKEEYLMTGPLEPTNEGFAMAKLATLSLARAYYAQFGYKYISAIPTNLYGYGDNLDPKVNHVIPGLVMKILDAREAGTPVTVWGTGNAAREFMHVDDAASAMVFLMEHYTAPEPINIGGGALITIKELALLLGQILRFTGEFVFDASKPDGMPHKQLDSARLQNLGWSSKIPFEHGLRSTCAWIEHIWRVQRTARF